jgi:hypothetical protein
MRVNFPVGSFPTRNFYTNAVHSSGQYSESGIDLNFVEFSIGDVLCEDLISVGRGGSVFPRHLLYPMNEVVSFAECSDERVPKFKPAAATPLDVVRTSRPCFSVLMLVSLSPLK